jgi:3'(2'), 5'-bisphosphate nucleotidase
LDAGSRILEVYDSADFGVTQKGDESPLTRADLAAHEHIVGRDEAIDALAPWRVPNGGRGRDRLSGGRPER